LANTLYIVIEQDALFIDILEVMVELGGNHKTNNIIYIALVINEI